MFKDFRHIFGPNFKNNIAIVLTRWDTSKQGIKKRLKSENGLTENKRVE